MRDGNFHHVAVTVIRNSTTGGNLYVDGVSVLTFDPTVEPGDLSNAQPLRIGNHPLPSVSSYFKGNIDEVSIYNRALSSTEIQAIYNAGGAGKCHSPAPAASSGVTTVAARNCLFKDGELTLLNLDTDIWKFTDNLFDDTDLNQTGAITHNYNGYRNIVDRLFPTSADDVPLTSLDYAPGQKLYFQLRCLN